MSDSKTHNRQEDLAGVTAWVLVDGDRIRWWQAHALELALARGLRISGVLECASPTPNRLPSHRIGLSLLQSIALRTDTHTMVPWRPIVGPEAQFKKLAPDIERNQHFIQTRILSELTDLKTNAIINFSVGLRLETHDLPTPCVLLSFHHEGPSGPGEQAVGFYEVLNDAQQVKAMVRVTSGTASNGETVQSSAHQVVSHSYSKTLDGLYRNSAHLLTKAIFNTHGGIEMRDQTFNSTLPAPSNRQVAIFFGVLLRRKLNRLVYGATRTKQWRVGKTDKFDPTAETGIVTFSTPVDYPVPTGYQFLADPLPGPSGSIWCEAMDTGTGLGRIIVLFEDQPPRAVNPPGTQGLHLAYPFVATADGNSYLIPEMSGTAPARIYRLVGNTPTTSVPLNGLEEEHLVDPTFHNHGGRWWLFAGKPDSSADLLWLWSSGTLHGPYEPHPDSPIVMNPTRARSGGPLFVVGGRLFRPGQNNAGAYGNGLTISEITELTEHAYCEEPIVEIRVSSRSGPHTIIVRPDHSIVDTYVSAFDPMAWLHRLRNRKQSTRTSGAVPVGRISRF